MIKNFEKGDNKANFDNRKMICNVGDIYPAKAPMMMITVIITRLANYPDWYG